MPQSLAKVYLHITFSTREREPHILPTFRDELFRVMGGISKNIDCPALLVGGVADHVHFLTQLSRTRTIAECVQQIKTNSSLWVNQSHLLPREFHWQKGYAAFSVSQSTLDAVLKYIANQEAHHAEKGYQEELREWLQRYEIEWDERHVWD
jgi:putative transposase